MTLDEILSEIQLKTSRANGLHARALFDFGENGCIHVDTTENPTIISTENKESDVTFITSIETFSKILKGETDPTICFMMGKLRVRGSLGLAMKINQLLED